MIKRFCLTILIAVSFHLTHSTMADIFYVASDGSDTSPYDTWVKAATDPQVAIDFVADTSGGPHQVWVKKGVYKPQFNPHTDTLIPREWCFALRNNVEVYGGFSGTESSLDQRDPATNQTILSGDRGDADTWADGTPIVDGSDNFNPPPTGDPSQDLPVANNSTDLYHVIYNQPSTSLDATAVLDGLIIICGNADGYIHYGGGMCNYGVPTLTNCTFSGNSASHGGGIYNNSYGLTLTNCTFSGNSASGGGGLYTDAGLILTNCTFSGNSASGAGGGMFNHKWCEPTLTNCTFSGNSASDGGGMYNFYYPILMNCTFSGNSASGSGGGMYNSYFTFGSSWLYSHPTLTNCTFSGNSASGDGGGLLVYSNCTATLTNCTFSENSAAAGGGISAFISSAVQSTNCIFWGDSGGEFTGFTDYSNFRYCIAPGDISGFGEGSLNSNPDLGSFGNYGGVTDCYSIPADSPAVGVGANVYRVTTDNDILIFLSLSSGNYIEVYDGTVYDITGHTLVMINSHDQRGRWRSEPVDIGSYEYGAEAPPNAPPWIYDYNGDATSDIAIFRSSSGLWSVRGITRVYFGSSDDHPVPGDYNGNNTTDIGVYRSSSGLWAIRGVTRAYFGSSSDTAIPGDYNGDGSCDMGIFRNDSGLWAIKGITRAYFGGSSDVAVPGYYNGDDTTDIGIFRGGSGLWAIRGISRLYFGSTGDEIVPGDYDGDGTWEDGIFRGSSGLWAIRGVTRNYFGSGSDQPVTADYDGDGRDDIGIFRGDSGLWAVRGVTRVYFGGSSDIPVTR